jgi:hypothetical protein
MSMPGRAEYWPSGRADRYPWRMQCMRGLADAWNTPSRRFRIGRLRRARERRGHTPHGEAAAAVAAHAPAPPLSRCSDSCAMRHGRGLDADLDTRYRLGSAGSFIGWSTLDQELFRSWAYIPPAAGNPPGAENQAVTRASWVRFRLSGSRVCGK